MCIKSLNIFSFEIWRAHKGLFLKGLVKNLEEARKQGGVIPSPTWTRSWTQTSIANIEKKSSQFGDFVDLGQLTLIPIVVD